MLKNVKDLTDQDFSGGLNTSKNIFSLKANQTPDCMDVILYPDGSIGKRSGSIIQNATTIGTVGTIGFVTDSDSTLATDMKAFWKLDEESGTRYDEYGSNELTDNNSVLSSIGKIGKAALFNANNGEYLSRISNDDLSTGDVNFFVSTWFYRNSTGEGVILSKADEPTGGINSYTEFLCHLDGVNTATVATDISTKTHGITFYNGANLDTTVKKFGSASLRIAGSPQQIKIGEPYDSWYFGDSDATIDFYFATSVAGESFGIFDSSIGTDDYQTLGIHGGNVLYEVQSQGTTIIQYSKAFATSANTLYHMALVKTGTSYIVYIDGSGIGTVCDAGDVPNFEKPLGIGYGRTSEGSSTNFMNGWIDEFRIMKGTANWGSDFTPSSKAYSRDSTDYEYCLSIDTGNYALFSVGSSGGVGTGACVRAVSAGTIDTATWYHVVAWHDTADWIGIKVNLSENTAAYTLGITSGNAPFMLGAISNGADNFFNGKIDETGFWKKIPTAQHVIDLYNSGAGNTYNTGQTGYTWGLFDFGASSQRWLVAAAGTGVYASSDLGVNFVMITCGQSATYHHFERSKNILVCTTDAHDAPLYWYGSGGSLMVDMVSAPHCRFSVNYQGFLILLNTSTDKRRFYYEDVNSQITGDWGDYFDIPSSEDDEITGAFVLRRNLYVSTRYKIYRVSYVGGNPDWSYLEIKNWGYVPRTAKKITIKDIGEVIIGLTWDKKIMLFDGADDRIISDNIEEDNGICEFSLDNLSMAGSGLVLCHAEVSSQENIYKLCLAIGTGSDQTTHILNFNGNSMAFYPFQNQPFQAMVMAESANKRFLLASDRVGRVHMLNTGNLDTNNTAIDEQYSSRILYSKSPAELTKARKQTLYFEPTSSGTIHYRDRIDFSSSFKDRSSFVLSDTVNHIQIVKETNIPSMQNVYQFQITSSANQANPWRLTRNDLFSQEMGIGVNP